MDPVHWADSPFFMPRMKPIIPSINLPDFGIGRKALRRIPVNEQIQLDPDKLRQAIMHDRSQGKFPFCVVATAGTTNSGAVDDLTAISEICRQENLWLHVDGAYGGAAIFSDNHRHLVRGIELADSIAIDPHK